MKEKPVHRPFVGIKFECCKVYARIYLNKKGTAYVGWCPKCAKRVDMKVSKNGTTDRFFEAS